MDTRNRLHWSVYVFLYELFATIADPLVPRELRSLDIEVTSAYTSCVGGYKWQDYRMGCTQYDRSLRFNGHRAGNRFVLLHTLFIHTSDMQWLEWQDSSRDFLLSLHPPYALILWNADAGEKMWKKTYTETLCMFTIDPFDHTHCACELFCCYIHLMILCSFNVNE